MSADKKGITIEITISEETEATHAPWWIIIDPAQMMSPSYHAVAGMITGPFFSREEAETHLRQRRYAFSNRAVVFCKSGHAAPQYNDKYSDARRKAGTG